MLSLFFDRTYEEKYNVLYSNLLEFPNVLKSINNALENYEIKLFTDNSDAINLKMPFSLPIAQQFYINMKGTLYKSSFKKYEFGQNAFKKLRIEIRKS